MSEIRGNNYNWDSFKNLTLGDQVDDDRQVVFYENDEINESRRANGYNEGGVQLGHIGRHSFGIFAMKRNSKTWAALRNALASGGYTNRSIDTVLQNLGFTNNLKTLTVRKLKDIINELQKPENITLSVLVKNTKITKFITENISYSSAFGIRQANVTKEEELLKAIKKSPLEFLNIAKDMMPKALKRAINFLACPHNEQTQLSYNFRSKSLDIQSLKIDKDSNKKFMEPADIENIIIKVSNGTANENEQTFFNEFFSYIDGNILSSENILNKQTESIECKVDDVSIIIEG